MSEHCVHVVDDDPAIRRSLGLVLGAHGFSHHEYASAEAFLSEYKQSQPGCVILDLRMPTMSGEELLKILRERRSELPVIMLTGYADVPVAVRAMKLGAIDVLQKPVDHAVLVDAVRRALHQDGIRRRRAAERDRLTQRLEPLTPRQREMLGMLATGKTSKQIALELGVSVKTVDNHRAELLARLQASNVAELAALAVRAGLA